MKAKLLILLTLFLLIGVSEASAADRVIVKLEPNGRLANIATFLRGRVLAGNSRRNIFLLELPAGEHARGRAFARLLGIKVLESNVRIKLNSANANGLIVDAGNKPSNWYDAQPDLAMMGQTSAHAISKGRGVVVADINSAVDYGHQALTGGLTSGYDFILSQPYDPSAGSLNQSSTAFLDQSSTAFLDQSSTAFLDGSLSWLDSLTFNFLTTSTVTSIAPSTLSPYAAHVAYSHGTLCAGVIRAVAPESMIMPLRAFNDAGETDLFTIVTAIDYAVEHGAHVINMSFGLNLDSEAVRSSVEAAQAAGITVVASSGNNNTNVGQYPAIYSGVISVAATDSTDHKGSFSNYGTHVDVSAPGVNIVSAFPGNYYAVVSGTSFAAPVVAGEAALLKAVQMNPLTRIPQYTVNIDSLNPGYQGTLGTGRINLSQALGGQ